MDIAIALLILIAALAVLAYPLYLSRPRPAIVSVSTLDDVIARRDGAYATLRDLELDHELGKLDDRDYNALRESYLVQASDILRELDALRGEGVNASAGDEIEKEIAALRRQPAEVKNVPKQEMPQGAEVASIVLECPNCGRPYSQGDRFCARCGKALA